MNFLSFGNSHVQRMVNQAQPAATPLIQAKLVLGAVNDRYEQEADHMARKVVGQAPSQGEAIQQQPNEHNEALMPKPAIQRMTGTASSALDSNVQQAIQQARGGGQAIPAAVRAPMERAFGTEFSEVRIHTDGQSDTLNQSIQAKAFTTGQDVFFRRGAYAPGSRAGQALLAHELTHVVQQRERVTRPRGVETRLASRGETGFQVNRGRQDTTCMGEDGHRTELMSTSPKSIQAFWVRKGNQYEWISDKTEKRKYVRTAEKRSTFLRPTKRDVRVEPWAPGTDLMVDAQLGGSAEEIANLETNTVTDLEKIHATDIGADLLFSLATQMGGRTTIQPQMGIKGPVTQTEKTKTGLSSTVILTPGDLDLVAALKEQGARVQEPNWNPTPSDVVLFHELVHAYHNLNGTKTNGPVAKEQAIHEGDIGIAMSEYQVVGLNAAGGDDGHRYADAERFTENAYRAETNRPHRDTYTPRRKPDKQKKVTKTRKRAAKQARQT